MTGTNTVVEADRSYSTLSWEYENSSVQTKVRAERTGNTVELAGTLNGKPVGKRFDTKGLPWFIYFEFGLANVIKSTENRMKIFVIHPSDMESFEMEATRKSVEEIPVNGIMTKAVKIKVNLTGIAALFWSESFWFNLDGEPVMLRSEDSKTVVELIGR